jgi:hypothetical protein
MFFSVKKLIKIGGKVYKPCICYEATRTLELTLQKLASAGKVVIYDERVFFQNGKVIKTEAMLKAEKKAEKKASRKAKKASEAKTEETTASEESVDESEGF